MSQRNPSQGHTRGASQKGLHGSIVPVVILDRGGRLHFHHAPGPFAASLDRQHHVGKGQCPFGTESSLEDRLIHLQERLCPRKGCLEAPYFEIDQRAFALGVIDLPGDVANLVTHREAGLGGRGVFSQVRAMYLQPQSLGALPKRQQLRFGKHTQGRLPLV